MSGSCGRSAPKRRSQRQLDKEMKEEAERIRLENQQLMLKERVEADRTKPQHTPEMELPQEPPQEATKPVGR